MRLHSLRTALVNYCCCKINCRWCYSNHTNFILKASCHFLAKCFADCFQIVSTLVSHSYLYHFKFIGLLSTLFSVVYTNPGISLNRLSINGKRKSSGRFIHFLCSQSIEMHLSLSWYCFWNTVWTLHNLEWNYQWSR